MAKGGVGRRVQGPESKKQDVFSAALIMSRLHVIAKVNFGLISLLDLPEHDNRSRNIGWLAYFEGNVRDLAVRILLDPT